MLPLTAVGLGHLLLVMLGWPLAALLPTLVVGGVLVAYLSLGPPAAFIVVRRLGVGSNRPLFLGLYLSGWISALATLAIVFEFQAQLVKFEIPLRVREPSLLTLLTALYLIGLVLIARFQARLVARLGGRVSGRRILPGVPLALPNPARPARTPIELPIGPLPATATAPAAVMAAPLPESRTRMADGGRVAEREPAPVSRVEPKPIEMPSNRADIDDRTPPPDVRTAPPATDPQARRPESTMAAPGPSESPAATVAPGWPERFAAARTVAADQPIEQIAEQILEIVNGALAPHCAVLIQQRLEHAFVIGPAHGPLALEQHGVKIPVAAGLLARLLETGRPVSTSARDEIARTGFSPRVERIDLFPLLVVKSEIRLALAMFNSALTPSEIEMLDVFFNHLSMLHENSRLRAERESLANDVSVLLEIARSMGSTIDIDELFRMILERSADFLQAEQGSLMLLDDDRRELSVRAMRGLNQNVAELLRIRSGEGIAGKVLATGSPLLVADIRSDERIAQEPRPRYKTQSFISIPLKLEGRTIGVLNVADKRSGEPFSAEDLHLLTSIGAYASVAIERSRFHLKTEELKKISITDSLTNLLNRRYFQERMSEEIERSRRHRLPLSLMMIDLDDFKKINDTFGHMTGDEVLKIVARCIRNSIRTIDVAARYGGEEFTVILPQTSKADAGSLAERICSEVSRLPLPLDHGDTRVALTVSIGLATYPEDAESLEHLVHNADLALYAAKSQGKNRVVIFKKS